MIFNTLLLKTCHRIPESALTFSRGRAAIVSPPAILREFHGALAIRLAERKGLLYSFTSRRLAREEHGRAMSPGWPFATSNHHEHDQRQRFSPRMKHDQWFLNACIVCLLSALFLSACTRVGPDYRPPALETPPQWNSVDSTVIPTAGLSGESWWQLFNDPLLNALVIEATAANHNLRKAEARIREARAQQTRAANTISLGSDASATTARRSDNTGSSASGNQDLFHLGFDASWEIDIFGGVHRTREAAEASLAAAHEEMRGVLVSLQAEVASNYLLLRGQQKRLATTMGNVATQEQTVALVRGRFQMGLGNELDLMHAETQLSLTRAALPGLTREIRQTMHQLAILLGQPPANLVDRLHDTGQDLAAPPQIPVNLPSDLVRQRPDIRAAERHLAAATAEIGVATAELFPRFSLSGLLGLQSRNLADLVTGSSRYWSLGPTISLSLFDQGSIHAGIEIGNARRDLALATYQETVLQALAEVENGLIAFTTEQETVRTLEQAVATSEKAVSIANGLYEAGLSDFLNVLQSEQALYQSQDQRDLSRQRLNLSLVSIYKALGGGWHIDATTSPTPVSQENTLLTTKKTSRENTPP